MFQFDYSFPYQKTCGNILFNQFLSFTTTCTLCEGFLCQLIISLFGHQRVAGRLVFHLVSNLNNTQHQFMETHTRSTAQPGPGCWKISTCTSYSLVMIHYSTQFNICKTLSHKPIKTLLFTWLKTFQYHQFTHTLPVSSSNNVRLPGKQLYAACANI